MQIIKKISLYILGIGLLLIGNRKFLQDLFHSSENEEDENKAQQNVSFDVMRLTYHPENDSLSSQQPYFQIMRYDPTQANASTHVESDHAETATASS
jgi:hypothetical protein